MLSRIEGQPEGVRFLNRVIEGTITTPLLLVGPSGVGRKFSVREAARAMFGESEHHGAQLDKNRHPDFQVVERDGTKDIGVEAIRSLVETSQVYPMMAPYRFFVLDGVDHMTPAAANALLKTLEEPPPYVRFFLLAERQDRVLPTIRSRSGRVRYYPLSEDAVVKVLSEYESNDVKNKVLARVSGGSAGKALDFWSSGKMAVRRQILSLFRAGLEGNISQIYSLMEELEDDFDLGYVFYRHFLHDVVVLNVAPDRVIHLDLIDDLRRLTRLTRGRLPEIQRDFVRLERLQGTSANFQFQLRSHFVGMC